MFNHYVAVDWAMSNMAIARMTSKSNKINVIDVPANIKELQLYLKNLKGSICLTFEESTTSQWLYTELKDCVDKLIICDPHRNYLLREGPKTDKIGAKKLVQLSRADLIKEVYHSSNKFIEIRKLVSGYEDLIKAGVRLKNQRSALFRSYNKNHKREKNLEGIIDNFVLQGLDSQILQYEEERMRYQNEFNNLVKIYPEIKRVKNIPGIGPISAVKIVARVVDAHRFKTRNHFLSYCGLIKLEKISGGKSYGKKNSRYCRSMKSVFKTGTLATISGDNQFANYYNYLLNNKKYSDKMARSAVSRKLASTVYGVMKSGKKYNSLKYKQGIKNVSKIVDL